VQLCETGWHQEAIAWLQQLLDTVRQSLLFINGFIFRQLEEAPGQVVYQSRQTLTEQKGRSLQAIACKRLQPDGNLQLYLRLVGFPGTVEINRFRALPLTNSKLKTLL
jgi:hypothetical protein